MKLRIWWHNNYTMGIRDAFRMNVESVEQAIIVLTALMNYDLHLGDVITDNASGLEMQDDSGEWSEWYDEDTGEDIWRVIEE